MQNTTRNPRTKIGPKSWTRFRPDPASNPTRNIFLGQLNENVLEKKFHFKIRDEKMPTESYLNHATLR